MSRITTYFQDDSLSIGPETPILGATVIRSPKGPSEIVKISKGNYQGVLNTYGYPSADYPDIQEVLDYITKGSIFVSAPYSGGKLSAVMVTSGGTINLGSGIETISSLDFSAIPVTDLSLGTGDGVEVTFTATIPEFARYNDQSIDIQVDGVTITISASDAEPEVLTSSPDVGDGTYTRATGALSFTFDVAPTTGQAITYSCTEDFSADAYFLLYTPSQQLDDLQVKITEDSEIFSIQAQRKNNDGEWVSFDQVYKVGLNPLGKDGSGRYNYVENTFANSYDFRAKVNTALTFTSFTDDTAYVEFDGGDRGDVQDDSDIATAFDLFTAYNTYPASIFFSCKDGATISAKFVTMRAGNEYKRSKFLMPVINGDKATLLADTLTAKNSVNERGINYFVGSWGTHINQFGLEFLSSQMGLIASKYYDSRSISFGGASPSWIDENGVGGLLGSLVTKLDMTITQDEAISFSAGGINAVIKDSVYGTMIDGDRTTQSVPESDYSYTIHSDLADYITQQIEKNVLPPQLKKPNDNAHRELVSLKADIIMQTVENRLEEYYIKCDEENNSAEVLTLRHFVLTVGVKFTPNSQFIDFIFVNGPQGLSIKEVVNKSA